MINKTAMFIKTHTNAVVSAVLAGLVINYHFTILKKFNFIWTDMDQLFMWFGLKEMRDGGFHMPRYWGQDYGSMLEAWLALPFGSIDYQYVLPGVSYFLLTIPFLIIVFRNVRDAKVVLMVITFLALMPPEYVMMAQPRDMFSGVAVAAFALWFTNGSRAWNYVLVGLFVVLGWSFNANAAVPGVAILSWMWLNIPKDERITKSIYLGGGILMGLAGHLSVKLFYHLNPGLVVHPGWEIVFDFEHFLKGVSDLDGLFGMISPVLHYKGWVYLLLLAGLLFWSYQNQNRAIMLSTIALMAFVIFSFGITKTHDASNSVFFSHERMYLGLPVALLFLISKTDLKESLLHLFTAAALVLVVNQTNRVDADVVRNIGARDHVLTISTVDGMIKKCKRLEKVWLEHKAEAAFFGPGEVLDAWIVSRGCPCVTVMEKCVRPDYERKSWEIQELGEPTYSRFLWISDQVSVEFIEGLGPYKATKFSVSEYPDIYLVEGENMSPMKIYEQAGFELPTYY